MQAAPERNEKMACRATATATATTTAAFRSSYLRPRNMLSGKALFSGLVLMLLLVSPTVHAQERACIADLLAADADGDDRLTSTEYTQFLAQRSDGRLPSQFSDLPFPYVSAFTFAACSCPLTATPTEAERCCVGQRSFVIDLNGSSSGTQATLGTVCRIVQTQIGQLPAAPTDAPTFTPTLAPSIVTDSPTFAPTRSTFRPTSSEEVCLHFQVGIVNTAGVSAEQIMNMENNTLKTGLVLATETVTIASLNGTYSTTNNNRVTLNRLSSNSQSHANLRAGSSHTRPSMIVPVDEMESGNYNTDGGFRQLMHSNRRKLAVYSEELPPEVRAVIENQFCPPDDSGNPSQCAIVTIFVCVTLEEGDDRQRVRQELRRGIQLSIEIGDFENAIPNEHRLPESNLM